MTDKLNSKSEYKLGQWLRVWSNAGKQDQVIGFVIGHGVSRHHWTGAIEAQTVIIKNAVWEIEVPESFVVEQIDPVEEWQRCAPNQPTPEWLQNHLKESRAI